MANGEDFGQNCSTNAGASPATSYAPDVVPPGYIHNILLTPSNERQRSPLAQHSIPKPMEDNHISIHDMIAPPRTIDVNHHSVSSITKCLGFPLAIIPVDTTALPLENRSHIYNPEAHLLSLECDSTKPTFGTFTTPATMGNVVLERCDGKTLEVHQLAFLFLYISTHIVSLIETYASASDPADKTLIKKWIVNRLHPRAFVDWIRENGKEPVEPFVEITEEMKRAPLCGGSCGALEHEDGMELEPCECEEVAYCSEACRKADWDWGHGVVCDGRAGGGSSEEE